MSTDAQIARLKAQLAGLEELLDIQERTVASQSERLSAQALELRQSNASLEQFAYVISHDLQEPLRMVSAYTELLVEKYREKLDGDALKYIDFASGGARRMQALINALLEYSRISTRAKPFLRVELGPVLDGVLQNLSLAIERSHAVVAREPLGAILGDQAQLAQLIQNLIANALKFHKSDMPPSIRISGQREGALYRLSIADDGIGIEPRHHQRIFEVFRRIHPKKYEGTGIGLAICQRIAERHGGTIEVASAAGAGSTFHILLPRPEDS